MRFAVLFESLGGVGAVVAAMASRRWRRAPRCRCGPVARERSSARRDAVDAAARESTDRVETAIRAGMEMTAYPVLVEIQGEMSRMKIIYDLYSAFEKFREDMSLTAWGELDVELLKEGVDKAEKEIKKLPKELKELSKYKAYELVVVSFKESLPVIVNLKNDAVKQARARRPVHRCGVGRTRSRRWRRVSRHDLDAGPLVPTGRTNRSSNRRRQDHHAGQDLLHGAQSIWRGRRRDCCLCDQRAEDREGDL